MLSLPQTQARAEELSREKTHQGHPAPYSQQENPLCINCGLSWSSTFKYVKSSEEMAWLPKKTETKHIKTNQRKNITTIPTSGKYTSLSRVSQTHSLPLGPPSELSTH